MIAVNVTSCWWVRGMISNLEFCVYFSVERAFEESIIRMQCMCWKLDEAISRFEYSMRRFTFCGNSSEFQYWQMLFIVCCLFFCGERMFGGETRIQIYFIEYKQAANIELLVMVAKELLLWQLHSKNRIEKRKHSRWKTQTFARIFLDWIGYFKKCYWYQHELKWETSRRLWNMWDYKYLMHSKWFQTILWRFVMA